MGMVFMFMLMIHLNWFLWYKDWHKSDKACLKHSMVLKSTHHFLDSLFCSLNLTSHPYTNTDYYHHTSVSKLGSESLQSYFSSSGSFGSSISVAFLYILELTYQFLPKKHTAEKRHVNNTESCSFNDHGIYLQLLYFFN